MNSFWQDLSRGSRIGLVAGISAIVIGTACAGFWLVRTDYQLLFSDMSMQDTSAMVAELERLKIPYKLGENGTSILVDKDKVLQTRLKLMSKEMPLHGAVGFELFNNTDFGMTEFAQKINYQRALQGELTRTILALSEVRDVRVHLAIPEQGLFKQANNRPKAAINLTLKQGEVLHDDQINGIQRLVSAAVPGVAVEDVTIVDQRGVALTRAAPDGQGDGSGSSGRLDLKKETENYLTQKVAHVLDLTFGPGQSIASVDVVLNMDQIRSTEEDVVGDPGSGGQAAGVVVHERETLHDSPASLDGKAADTAAHAGSSQRETDYQVGRRVRQIVGQPGTIQHIQVVALVRKPMDLAQIEEVKKIVAAASGLLASRGDTVEVDAVDSLAMNTAAIGGKLKGDANADIDPASVTDARNAQHAATHGAVAGTGLAPVSPERIVIALLLILVAAIGLLIGWTMRRSSSRAAEKAMTDAERRSAMAQIQNWLNEPGSQRDAA